MTKYQLVFEETQIIVRANSVAEAISRGRFLGRAGAGELISVKVAQ